MMLNPQAVSEAVRLALAEDVGPGDVTSCCTISADRMGSGEIVSKEEGVIAGLDIAAEAYSQVDGKIAMVRRVADGRRVLAGDVLAAVSGPVRGMLTAERTALNFLQRLSGVATLTRQYVERIEGTGAVILDTRKTTPGLRLLEKYAVQVGGGRNHRLGLYDMVMIKDTHWNLIGDLPEAVARCRHKAAGIFVEVEAGSMAQVLAAIEAGIDRIMLDNMGIGLMKEAVAVIRQQCRGSKNIEIEASGGVTLATVRQVAETGVDFISVGALTHSAPALDIAFYLRP